MGSPLTSSFERIINRPLSYPFLPKFRSSSSKFRRYRKTLRLTRNCPNEKDVAREEQYSCYTLSYNIFCTIIVNTIRAALANIFFSILCRGYDSATSNLHYLNRRWQRDEEEGRPRRRRPAGRGSLRAPGQGGEAGKAPCGGSASGRLSWPRSSSSSSSSSFRGCARGGPRAGNPGAGGCGLREAYPGAPPRRPKSRLRRRSG